MQNFPLFSLDKKGLNPFKKGFLMICVFHMEVENGNLLVEGPKVLYVDPDELAAESTTNMIQNEGGEAEVCVADYKLKGMQTSC